MSIAFSASLEQIQIIDWTCIAIRIQAYEQYALEMQAPLLSALSHLQPYLDKQSPMTGAGPPSPTNTQGAGDKFSVPMHGILPNINQRHSQMQFDKIRPSNRGCFSTPAHDQVVHD